MPIMEISVVPLGTKTASVSKYVAGCISVLKRQKHIDYELTSMGTVIQAGSVKRLLEIAGKMHRAAFNKQVKRVVTTIKIDHRSDKRLTIKGKTEAVKNKIRI